MTESLTVAALAAAPNALAADYRQFRVAERLLLSGHSHQAWPDVAFAGQLEAAEDAARWADAKWEHAMARAERVREGYRQLLGDPEGEIALASATHDLLVRLLSALPFERQRRVVTTDGEFHSLRRQLARIEQDGFEIVREPVDDIGTLSERLASRVDDSVLAVFVSAVLYETARIVPGLDALAARCARHGVPLVVDAYHALGVMPFRLHPLGLESAFVVGGGYKYLQLGEGNAFLRLPPGTDLHPRITGWFAEFDALARQTPGQMVAWGSPASRFAGATYDPTSHYRAARVMTFFVERGLTPELLRAVSQHQVGRLAARFDALDLPPDRVKRDRRTPIDGLGGFLALESPRAGELCEALSRRGVLCDHRGERLRLGPAPYLSDAQLDTAIELLGELARA